MIYLYLFVFVGAMGIYGYMSYKISSLESENESLSSAIEVSLRANKELEIALNETEIEHKKNIELIAGSKEKNDKERVYVEKIKYKIIKDNNSSCVGAINDVFYRLQEQTRDNHAKKRKAKE